MGCRMTTGPDDGELYVEAQEEAQRLLVECREKLTGHLVEAGFLRFDATQVVSALDDLMNAWAHKRRLDE